MSDSIKAVGYARYSSSLQNEESIESQFLEIEKFCAAHNIIVVEKFADYAKSAAGDHENRTEFWKAVEVAKERDDVTMFIVSDSSRFFRNKAMAIKVKTELVKHNVAIEYAMSPLPKDDTARLAVESVYELTDQLFSMNTGKHTLRGQKANAAQRDPETGWSYKNGGQIPYGYKGKKLDRGKDRHGKPMTKLIWVPDEETSPWYRYIKVTCRIQRRMTYSEIRDDLNAKNVPTARGGKWSVSSLSSLCGNETYVGTHIFNKRNMHHPSQKVIIKPEDDWIVVENAHEPLCTKEEHEFEQSLFSDKKRRSNGKKDGRGNRSPWLLTDILFCSNCGNRFVGGHGHYSSEREKSKKVYYLCAGYKNHSASVCSHRFPIDKLSIEQFVLDMVKTAVCDKRITEKVFDRISDDVDDFSKTTGIEISKLSRQLKAKDSEIKGIVGLLKAPNLTPVAREILVEDVNKLAEECHALKTRMVELDGTSSRTPKLSIGMFQEFLQDFRMEFDSQDINVIRRALKGFFHSIVIDPNEKIMDIHKYAGTGPETERAILLDKAKGHGSQRDAVSYLAVARAGYAVLGLLFDKIKTPLFMQKIRGYGKITLRSKTA